MRQVSGDDEDLQQFMLPEVPGRSDKSPIPEPAELSEAKPSKSVAEDILLLPATGKAKKNHGTSQLPAAAAITFPDPAQSTDNVGESDTSGDRQLAETRATGNGLLLQSARNAVRLRRMNLAVTRFAEHLRRYPNDVDARLELAGALAASGRSDTASQHLEHLLEQFPDNLPLLRRYADMQVQLSNFPKAQVALRELMYHPEYRIDAAIDLARIFAWTNRLNDALRIYEDVLSDVALDSPNRMLKFAELLLDMRRPVEALDLLLPLHETNSTDLVVLKLIVIANARLGDSSSTFDYVSRLQSIEPENTEIRHDLADILFQSGFFRESLLVDQQVLAFEPTNLDSLVRSALANLRLYEVVAAKSKLEAVEQSKRVPKYFRAVAEYHSAVGNHADAIAICQRVLGDLPGDSETRMTLGHAYHRAGQLRRSNHEFGRIVSAASQLGAAADRKLQLAAQLAQARVLAEARRFDEALAVLDGASARSSVGPATLDAYVDVLSKARRYSMAAELVRSALSEASGMVGQEVRLRAMLGLILARRGDYASAIHEFSVAQSGTSEPIAEVVYGTYQAHRMLGHAAEAQRALDRHLSALVSNVYLRVRVAELATQDCDCCLARRMLQPLERICAVNPLISNRLGEACLQCASCEGVCDCAGYFHNALVHSPSNVQAMLGLARLSTRRGLYHQADLHYQQAVRHMPEDTNVLREVARMYRQWKGPDAAVPLYNQALEVASGEHIIESAMNAPHRVAELELEYAELADVAAVVSTEMQGKQLAGWKPMSAIQTFEGAASLEPRNEDSVFEIAQAFSHLNRTHCAIEQYERLLCINPCHREAAIAVERNYLEMQPQLHLIGVHRDQAGRDDLASIRYFTSGALLQFPLGEEDEFLNVGYRRAWYDVPQESELTGDIAMARLQWKPEWPTVVFAQFDYETFDFGIQPRINFDVGTRHRYMENAELRVHLMRQNVIQNRVSIHRDIHRAGGEIGNRWQPSLLLDVDAFYRYWEYSDANAAHEAGLHMGYKLTHGRDQFRWLTAVDYMSYREPAVFSGSGELELVSHPYFAPRDFWYLSAGLEYRRYLGCDTFKGANRHWFELYGGGGIDSEGSGYGEARGELARDFSSRLSMSGYFTLTRSGIYDETEAGGRFTIRF